MIDQNKKTRIVASAHSWIEGEAIRQLEQTATLPGMIRAVGMPDLHPGKGTPVGATFQSVGVIYPHLVGSDIGCGMGLWQTDILNRKVKLDHFVKNLSGLEQAWQGDVKVRLSEAGLEYDGESSPLGTIGGGNHFAELQKLENIYDDACFTGLGLDGDRATLLVHSGSRGLGEAVLRSHVAKHGGNGLIEGTDAFNSYIRQHNHAVKWGVVNRQVIAERFLDCLNAHGKQALDICHNSVTPYGDTWLHRKGAAPSDKGAVVIPGSRGAITYVVKPMASAWDVSLCSLAHGAGRRWKRSEVKAKLFRRYKVADLTQTKLGGRVICEDKDLIFEEAPEAYKDIEQVMSDLVEAGLITLVASYRPIITYKTRRI